MAKIHDKFVIELAEVIKGYGNDPDVDDPFHLSKFYRFYELPNIAVSRENFEKMRPVESQRTGKWIRNPDDTAGSGYFICSECKTDFYDVWKYCPNCGAKME